MSRRLAVNSSPIILLGRISRLDLLPGVAERVVVPQSVLRELRVKGGDDSLAGAASAHPGFDIVEDPQVAPVVQRWNLGAGEAAVLSFCLLNEGYRAVLDDLRGRRCARALNVPLFGTLGVIVEAKRRGLVPAARPLVAAIRAAGYYIDDELIVEALRQVGESWEE